MLILAVGIGIVFCIIVFICYSYKQNQRSKYTSEVYKVFKGQYGRESVISMGYAQTNAFTEPVTLMLAVSKDDQKSQMMNQTMGRDSAKKQAFDMALQQILGKLGK